MNYKILKDVPIRILKFDLALGLLKLLQYIFIKEINVKETITRPLEKELLLVRALKVYALMKLNKLCEKKVCSYFSQDVKNYN